MLIANVNRASDANFSGYPAYLALDLYGIV